MTEKNIGIAPEQVPGAVRQLLLDVSAQLEAHSYPIREIAALRAADRRDYGPLLQFLDVS